MCKKLMPMTESRSIAYIHDLLFFNDDSNCDTFTDRLPGCYGRKWQKHMPMTESRC